jgi:hypothetical protein
MLTLKTKKTEVFIFYKMAESKSKLNFKFIDFNIIRDYITNKTNLSKTTANNLINESVESKIHHTNLLRSSFNEHTYKKYNMLMKLSKYKVPEKICEFTSCKLAKAKSETTFSKVYINDLFCKIHTEAAENINELSTNIIKMFVTAELQGKITNNDIIVIYTDVVTKVDENQDKKTSRKIDSIYIFIEELDEIFYFSGRIIQYLHVCKINPQRYNFEFLANVVRELLKILEKTPDMDFNKDNVCDFASHWVLNPQETKDILHHAMIFENSIQPERIDKDNIKYIPRIILDSLAKSSNLVKSPNLDDNSSNEHIIKIQCKFNN